MCFVILIPSESNVSVLFLHNINRFEKKKKKSIIILLILIINIK